MSRQRGFSLIELVIVMLIISGGVLGLAGAFGNAAKSLTINESLQQAAQYGQECAEKALANRHDNGFAGMAAFACDANPAGYTRVAAVGAVYTGTAVSACPNSIQCRDIVITTTSTSNGTLNSSITVMLASY